MRRSLPFVLTVLTACNGSDAPKDDTDDVDINDTYKPDTDVAPDTDIVVDPSDSGVQYAIELDGRAEVAADAKLDGWQTYTARWLLNGEPRGPARCIYAQRVRNWERDPRHEGEANPLSEDDFELCNGCEFAFTVTFTEANLISRYPWTVDTDTDADTDTDLPVDVVPGEKLNCDSLVDPLGYQRPDEVPTDPQGWAFDADLDGDDDETTGLWLLWVARYSSWSVYSYDVTATYDPESAEFRWRGMTRPYTYY